jgi:hypothetical protein
MQWFLIRARQDAAEWDVDSLITNRIRTDHDDDHPLIDDHLPVLRPSRDGVDAERLLPIDL